MTQKIKWGKLCGNRNYCQTWASKLWSTKIWIEQQWDGLSTDDGGVNLEVGPQSCVSYWPNLRYNYDYSSSHKKVPPLITLQEKFWNLSFRDKVCFKDTDPFYLVSKESFLKIKHVKHFRSYCSIIVHVKRKWACAEKWHVKVIPWFAKWTHKKRNGVPKTVMREAFIWYK